MSGARCPQAQLFSDDNGLVRTYCLYLGVFELGDAADPLCYLPACTVQVFALEESSLAGWNGMLRCCVRTQPRKLFVNLGTMHSSVIETRMTAEVLVTPASYFDWGIRWGISLRSCVQNGFQDCSPTEFTCPGGSCKIEISTQSEVPPGWGLSVMIKLQPAHHRTPCNVPRM